MAVLSYTVTAFSSESKGFEAKLIAADADGKWQGQAPGSHEFVIIQLSRPSVIGKLVVNNNSAAIFSVEACDQRDAQERSKWHVLLGTSSLMKPSEARDETHGTNNFTFTKFKDDAKDGLWHCLKFNVFQPFNKNLPCGLSSVQVYSADTDAKANSGRRTPSPIAEALSDEENSPIRSHTIRARGNIRSLISSGKPSYAVNSIISADDNDGDDIHEIESDHDEKSSARGRAPAKPSLISKAAASRSTADDTKPVAGSSKRNTGKGSSRAGSRSSRAGSRNADSEDDDVKSHSSQSSRGQGRARKAADDVNGRSTTTAKRQTRASSRTSDASSVRSKDDTSTSGRTSARGGRRKATAADVEQEAEEVGEDEDEDGLSQNNVKKRRATSPKRAGSRSSRQTSKSPEPPARAARGAPRVSPLRDDDVENAAASSRHSLRSEKPFHKIMDDVVFSLSGFVNPERSQLRSDAIQMGARFKPDWTDDCNYLVCAFPDTPKFEEAVACNAHIVKKDWINECYRQRKLLPWRQYRLHGYENAVDDDKVDDAVIRDSAAETAEDKRSKSKSAGRGAAAASSSSSTRGRRGRGGATASNRRSRGADEAEYDETDDELDDKAAALAELLGDDEDQDQDYVPDEDEAEAAEEEEEEDAKTAPDPREVLKEEAEADAEIQPEDIDEDLVDDLDDDEAA